MTNPYLTGAFAPVTEEITAFHLPVTGAIPAHLNGRYLRNGPNPLGIEEGPHIWTLGEGMVHGVRLREGRAEWYRNRWVRSGGVADRLAERRRGVPADERMDFAPNVHVAAHAGRLYALIEGGIRPYELTFDLETVGPSTLGVTPEGYSASAHSKYDPVTGELHSLAFLYGSQNIQHIVIGREGRVTSSRLIEAPGNPYMHDFGLTDRHVLIFDSPIVFSPAHLATGVPFTWDPTRPSRVGVTSRRGGSVRWFELSHGMVGHTVNAYDTARGVVADVIVHPKPYDLRDVGRSRPVLERWSIDLVSGRVRQDVIDDRPQDFPRINTGYSQAPNRYAYTASNELYTMPESPGFTGHLLKHDLHSGGVEAHPFTAVGEAVFVPAESPTGEDDGYLMTYAHDPERGASDLVILSARDFTAPPLARVHLPVRVPLGLHGSWVPER